MTFTSQNNRLSWQSVWSILDSQLVYLRGKKCNFNMNLFVLQRILVWHLLIACCCDDVKPCLMYIRCQWMRADFPPSSQTFLPARKGFPHLENHFSWVLLRFGLTPTTPAVCLNSHPVSLGPSTLVCWGWGGKKDTKIAFEILGAGGGIIQLRDGRATPFTFLCLY